MSRGTKRLVHLCFALCAVGFLFTGRTQTAGQPQDKTGSSRENNIDVMRKLFRAVEEHDPQTLAALCQPDAEFHWPPSLPYGSMGGGARAGGQTWSETWALLQPTAEERKMDPRIVAASNDEVVAVWHQRGLSPAGERFEGDVLGLYRFRDGKLARAQMFYFDTTAVNNFLMKAITPDLRAKSQAVFGEITQLPADRQILVRGAYWRLQAMTPSQQRAELRSGSSPAKFSEHERELLERLLSLTAPHDK
jgi:ketosteroid isomerase-like protein